MENLDLLNNDLQLSAQVQNYLSETAKWAKFLSIVGFIMCGLMIIFAFVLPGYITQLSPYNQMSDSALSGIKGAMIFIYIILAILLFFPCLFLYRFSSKMQASLKFVSQDGFEESLKNLKSTFKFYGIMAIIILSLYALIFIAGIIIVAVR